MALKRIHVALSAAQIKNLDKLAAKIGLDRTNAVRYCIARITEVELSDRERVTEGTKRITEGTKKVTGG